jgi:DNA polymerase-3 subunit delta
MPITPARWPKLLAADTLAPVYLLAGAPLLVIEAADGLLARARELGYAEREVLEAGSRFDWDDLARAAAGMSLFAARRLLDLRVPGGRPGIEGAKAITAFCADPPEGVSLLVTALEWSKKHEGAWSRKLDAAGVMAVFNAPQGRDWLAWIGARLASRGLSASREAIALLGERAEGNLLAAAQEIDKLAVLHQGGRLGADQMENLVADSARYDVFKLTDAAFAGDGARALRILGGLRAEGDELLALMGWLVNQLQLALRLASAANLDAQMQAEHVFATREKLLRQALRRAPRGHWLDCLRRAGRIDRMAKGRAQGDPWREAERLVAVIAEPHLAVALA